MTSSRKDIKTILQILTKVLDNISEEQYHKLLIGEGTLVYKESVKKFSNSKRNSQILDDAYYIQLGEKIRSCQNREEAYKAIKNEPTLQNKNGLLKFARVLEVNVTKRDTRERIEDKIVESVVGSKIRFQALKDFNKRAKEEEI